MGRGVRIGRILGIEIRIDPSWILIVLLLVWSLTSLFATWHPAWSTWMGLTVAIVSALLFFASVLFHELAHSLVARGYGLPVRDITLFLFGGISSIERESPRPGVELAIAVVGPLASIALGITALTLAGLSMTWSGIDPRTMSSTELLARLDPVTTLLLWLGPVNLGVGIFNMVPGYPLDGGRVLRAILWKITGDQGRATRAAASVGQLVGFAFMGVGVLMALGVRFPLFGTGIVSGLWLALIGLFLRGAAAQGYAGATIREALSGIRVRDLMRGQGPWVDGGLPLKALVEGWFLRRDERAFPVFVEGKFVGLVCLDDVRRIGPAHWDGQVVADAMTPAAELVTAAPDEPLVDALGKLGRGDVGQLPVVREGVLLGVLFERDVARWLELESSSHGGHHTLRTSHA